MQNTHPLVLVAAGAVTIASLAAAAHFTGLIPSRNEAPPAPVQVASLPAPVVAAPVAPAPKAETVLNVPPGATVTISPEGSQVPPSVKPKPQASAPAPTRQTRHSEPRYSDYDGNFRRTNNGDNGIDVIPSSRPSYPNQNANSYPSQPSYNQQAVCRECGTVDSVREIASQGEGTGVGAVAGGVLGGVLGHQVGRGKGKDAATILGAVGGAVAGHQIEKNVRTEKQYQVSVRFDDGSYRSYTLTNTQWRAGDRVRMSGGTLSAL